MLLKKKDVQGINVAIQPSPLLSADLIKAAQNGDPALWAGEVSKQGGSWSNIAQGQAEYWGESRASLVARAGVTFGVPSNLLVQGAPIDFLDDVLDFAMTAPSAKDFGFKFAQMGISVVTQILSPIPIVGWIAQAVGGIANLILGLNQRDPIERMEEFPEFQDYSDEIDAGVAGTIRTQMNEPDWNPLFLPRYGNSFESQRRGEGGKMLMFIGKERGPGLGYVPGTQRIIGAVQVGPVGNAGMTQIKAQNLGNWYPTAAQLMTALWGQINSPGPYMYFVHANKVRDTWDDYVSAAIEYVNDHLTPRDYSDDPGAYYAETIEVAELKAAIRPFFKQTFNAEMYSRQDMDYRGKRKQTIFGAYIRPAMKKLRQRQEFYLGKLTVAYIDLNGAAFQDRALKEKAIENRILLLEHPSRFQVRLDDVIDDEYRAALIQSGVKKIPLWKLKVDKPGFVIKKPPKKLKIPPELKPDPIEGGAPGVIPKEPSKISPWLVAAGLGGGAYYAYKHRRRLVRVFS